MRTHRLTLVLSLVVLGAPAWGDDRKSDINGDSLPLGAIVRIGTQRFRHNGTITCLAYSPDGKFLASVGDDGLRLWESTTGKHAVPLLPVFGIESLAFSPDSRIIAVGGRDKTVSVWEVAEILKDNTTPIQLCGHENVVQTVAFSHDGKTLFSGGRDGSLRAWDWKETKELRRMGEERQCPRALAVSADGKVLAYSAFSADAIDKYVLHICNAETGELVRKFTDPGKLAFSLAFTPDGKYLAAASGDGVRLWDAATGKRWLSLDNSSGYASGVAFSPNGKTLVGGVFNQLHFWEVATGKEIRRVEGRQLQFSWLAFSPDGKTVAAAGQQAVSLWDAASGKPPIDLAGNPSLVSTLLFTPDGRTLITGGYDNEFRRWEAGTGRFLGRCARGLVFNYETRLTPDGKALLQQGENGTLRFTDPLTAKDVRVLDAHKPASGTSYAPLAFAVSTDGKLLLTAQSDGDNTVRLWDLPSGKELRRFEGHARGAYSVAISPDNSQVATVSRDGLVRLWDLEGKKEKFAFRVQENSFPLLAFSPDGRRLAVCETDVVLLDLATGKALHRIHSKTGNWYQVLSFSPDGRTLALVGGASSEAQLCEVASGKERLRVGGHGGSLRAAVLSPDGRLLSTGSDDTTALVWDVEALALGARRVKEPSADELTTLWTDLASEDAAEAYRALILLRRNPKQSMPFLTAQLGPVTIRGVEKLIGQLDDEDFDVRERATRDLIALGRSAEPGLRKAIRNPASAEAKRRLESILERLDKYNPMQGLRALEILEGIGTPEARQLVEEMARGAPEELVTIEAKAQLLRMKNKDR
jgi:WD40 repeat protein